MSARGRMRRILGVLWLLGSIPVRADPQIYYYHLDHLGTPQLLTDANQEVVWRADYEPFGQATVTVETVVNPLRLPGQYYDAETGLHYNYYRDYDPATGRYIQSDPIGLEGGINTYSYAEQNPLRYSDPLGLVPNPGEAACLVGPNPVCVGSLVTDVVTSLLSGAALARVLSMSGDTLSDQANTDAEASSGDNNRGCCNYVRHIISADRSIPAPFNPETSPGITQDLNRPFRTHLACYYDCNGTERVVEPYGKRSWSYSADSQQLLDLTAKRICIQHTPVN